MNVDFIKTNLINILPTSPEVSVILGSGLGNFIHIMENIIAIPYSTISGFPNSTVSGHSGQLIFGYINKKPILCFSGRFHYYEALSDEQVNLPILLTHALGCNTVIITNSSGCLRKDWSIGDLMLITGYIDYSFSIKQHVPKIVDINISINRLKKIDSIAKKIKINLHKGIYTWTLGPSYETPSEIKDIILLGGNAVGMSTVPEIICATNLGLEVLGISCFTNYGAGMVNKKLSHLDVLSISNKVNKKFSELLKQIIKN